MMKNEKRVETIGRLIDCVEDWLEKDGNALNLSPDNEDAIITGDHFDTLAAAFQVALDLDSEGNQSEDHMDILEDSEPKDNAFGNTMENERKKFEFSFTEPISVSLKTLATCTVQCEDVTCRILFDTGFPTRFFYDSSIFAGKPKNMQSEMENWLRNEIKKMEF